MPTVTMLIGLPGCGKSTWRAAQFSNAITVSSDDHIELMARLMRKTYNEVFRDFIDDAERICNIQFEYAIACGLDMVIDRTNLSKKARRKWLARIPKNYRVEAIVFADPQEESDVLEWEARLNSRIGKTIPSNVLATMRQSFEFPSPLEQFDTIQFVNTFGT